MTLPDLYANNPCKLKTQIKAQFKNENIEVGLNLEVKTKIIGSPSKDIKGIWQQRIRNKVEFIELKRWHL